MPYLLSRGNIDANTWNEISVVLTKNVFLFGFNDFSFGHLLKQTKEKTRGRTNDDQESINEPTSVFLKHSVFAFQQAEQQMANAVKQSMGLVDFKVS